MTPPRAPPPPPCPTWAVPETNTPTNTPTNEAADARPVGTGGDRVGTVNVSTMAAIVARLAWAYVPSEENNKVFGRPQSFVAGPPKNGVQFMVKDSKKYAATGGWGFAHFNDGKLADEAVLNTCFSCHETVKDRDFVFNRYAP